MDPLTHAVSGAAIGAARFRRGREVLWLALLAMAPDLDIAFRWVSDVFYLEHHRGVTHSLLMLPLWAWLFARILRPRAEGLHAGWIAAALGAHIALDLITSFGTMIFAPLSRFRASLDWVFIVDPMLTLPALFAVAVALWRRSRRWGWAACAWIAGYIGLCGGLHARALAVAQARAPAAAESFAAFPLPFSPTRWRLVAIGKDKVWTAALELMPGFPGLEPLFPRAFAARWARHGAPSDALAWRAFPRPDWDRLARRAPDAVRFYRWFAPYAVVLGEQDDRVVLGDLRFGAGAWPEDQVPFRLEIAREGAALIWGKKRARFPAQAR